MGKKLLDALEQEIFKEAERTDVDYKLVKKTKKETITWMELQER